MEVLDNAAALHMAIRSAEVALMEPDLTGDERSLLESVLNASKEKQERVAAILEEENHPIAGVLDEMDDAGDWSEQELFQAGRAADEGSVEAEGEASRAIDCLGRELRLDVRASIEKFLTHSSPLLRASAVKVLALHWRLIEYTEQVLWMLASDTEPECRRAAALALGSLYEGTHHRGVGRELVLALRREYEEPDVRWASYYALLAIDGVKPEERPLPLKDFDWAAEADTGIVNAYAGGSAAFDDRTRCVKP